MNGTKMYSTALAFLEALSEAGVEYCFVNLGSDHTALMEAMGHLATDAQRCKIPEIVTCPHEMVALSMADGYARLSGKPQCVIVHTDVGTQNLGCAVHNASVGRAPVLIFAGLSPYTAEGEYTGSRTEHIHWWQDVPDQRQIVAQYCRYTGEIRRGANVKQMVNRALSLAMTEPKGPVYLVGSREAMEEKIARYSLQQSQWGPAELAGLREEAAQMVADLLLEAQEPLIIVGYTGSSVATDLVHLAETIKGLRILDAGGNYMNFPANHPSYLGHRIGAHESISTADIILVLDCDVPWIHTLCHPSPEAKIVHIDVDPLKQQMPLFYINAVARYRGSVSVAVKQILDVLQNDRKKAIENKSVLFNDRWSNLLEAYAARVSQLDSLATPAESGTLGTSFVMAELRAACPKDTAWVVEAVTNASIVADQIRPDLENSWFNCGAGGLGWSTSAALGIKLALDHQAQGRTRRRFVCQIVGDGAYMFSVPSAAHWVAHRYKIPVLTIVLNNGGWNAPRSSLLLVHRYGEGSKVGNDALNISFEPCPEYSGFAQAASANAAFATKATTVNELKRMLPAAVEAVESGITAVIDVRLTSERAPLQ